MCRVHLIPTAGRLRLGRLQPTRLDAVYAERLAAGSRPTTVHHVHMVLHRALGAAVRQCRVNRNVASLATPPRMALVEMRVLDPAEVRHLCAVAAEEADHGALLILAVTTGMRQGELLALRWRDADLERGTLAVTGTLQRVNGEGLVRGEPKTARSRRRKTPAHADRSSRSPPPAGDPQAAARLTVGDRGPRVTGCSLGRSVLHVIPTQFAPPGTASADAQASPDQIPRLCRRRHNHDLRHTAATLLLGEGVHPQIVADLLGHATVAITLDRYSHVAMAMHQGATDALEAVLQEPRAPRVGSTPSDSGLSGGGS